MVNDPSLKHGSQKPTDDDLNNNLVCNCNTDLLDSIQEKLRLDRLQRKVDDLVNWSYKEIEDLQQKTTQLEGRLHWLQIKVDKLINENKQIENLQHQQDIKIKDLEKKVQRLIKFEHGPCTHG